MKRKGLIVASVLAVLILIGSVVYSGVVTAEMSRSQKVEIMKKTRYIAHRGLSSKFHQNSEAAFAAAAKSDFFYGIETDIWRTSDGVWVCCHDQTPFADKTIKIDEITYEAAKSIPLDKAQAGEGIDTSQDVFICEYETYLTICKEGGKTPIIEIKFNATAQEVKEALELADGINGLKNVQVISFFKEVIDAVLEYNNAITAQLLASSPWGARYGIRRHYNMDVYYMSVTPFMVGAAHRNGRYLSVWTVNKKSTAKRLAAMGVDFITTDYDFSEK